MPTYLIERGENTLSMSNVDVGSNQCGAHENILYGKSRKYIRIM
jgi:hypothetical protein